MPSKRNNKHSGDHRGKGNTQQGDYSNIYSNDGSAISVDNEDDSRNYSYSEPLSQEEIDDKRSQKSGNSKKNTHQRSRDGRSKHSGAVVKKNQKNNRQKSESSSSYSYSYSDNDSYNRNKKSSGKGNNYKSRKEITATNNNNNIAINMTAPTAAPVIQPSTTVVINEKRGCCDRFNGCCCCCCCCPLLGICFKCLIFWIIIAVIAIIPIALYFAGVFNTSVNINYSSNYSSSSSNSSGGSTQVIPDGFTVNEQTYQSLESAVSACSTFCEVFIGSSTTLSNILNLGNKHVDFYIRKDVTVTAPKGFAILGSISSINGGTIDCSGYSGNCITAKSIFKLIDVTMKCGRSGNSANGSCLNASGNITISNCTIKDSYSYNGAIYISSGNGTIENSTFSNNSSGYFGGAIVDAGGNLNINNTEFTGNKASQNGGAINMIGSGIMNIKNCTFTQNNAGYNGGALEFTSGIVTIEGSKFNNNSARNRGGAVYIVNGHNIEDISSNTFSGNTPEDYYTGP